MINLSEAIQKIKKAGASNARSVPMAGQNVNTGLYQIELMSEGTWTAIVSGIPKITAEQIIQQATNRVLLS